MRTVLKAVILYFQRLSRRNRIQSPLVHPSSLLGRCIVIGSATRVDSLSSIESYSYLGDRCNVTRARIGRYVSIGNNVSIGPGQHNLERLSTSAHFYGDAYEELTQGDCIVESDAWIGVDAIILRGVRIGVGAVVAANAVVTKDVPNYAVVAGVPARVIKYRFDEKMQARLLASLWWLKERDEAEKLLGDLSGSSGSLASAQ